MCIDREKGLILVKGAIPGYRGSLIKVLDAHKKRIKQFRDLYYPTFIPQDGFEYPAIEYAKPPEKDPSNTFLHENAGQAGPEESEEED